MYKIIVAHPHQQYSYQLATSLNMAGMLYKYITTVYQKPHSLTSKITSLLSHKEKEKALGRKSKQLSDNQVLQYCEFYGLIYLLLMRLTKNNKKVLNPYNRFVSRCFGKKVAKYAIKNQVNAVVCYDTECLEMFRILEKKAPQITRIMDASAINRLYLKHIYEKDMELFPEFADRLKSERPELFAKDSPKVMELLQKEIDLTQYFLVPSEIVSTSFQYSGATSEQFLKCPYGVDLEIFKMPERTKNCRPLNVIYVGGIKELKGVGHLLKAFKKIDPEDAILTIVGEGNINDEDIYPYSENVIFTGMVNHSQIPHLLEKSDIFVFPSLGDSFGLAVLEGMACGLPVIVSENAGVSEYIRDAGYVISVFSVNDIVEKVNWFIDHPNERNTMGIRAVEVCKEFQWNTYHNNICRLVKDCLDKEHKVSRM